MTTETMQSESQFIRFPTYKLIDQSHSDFDLFVQVREQYILYAPPGYYWGKEEIGGLIRDGHVALFAMRKDIQKLKMYLTLGKLLPIQKELAPIKRLQAVEQVGADFIHCLHQGEITRACISKADELSSTLTDCIAEDRSCIKHLASSADRDFYTYFHGIRVAAYSTAIALEMGVSRRRSLTRIALGGIFHDIGKKNIPLKTINKAGTLNKVELASIRSHVTEGHKLVEGSILEHVPKEIILHHHEKRNGSGYPHGLDKNSLMVEVQIATLADIFDALTSSRCYENKRSKFDALSFIKHNFLKDHLSVDAFKALVSCLA